MASTNISIITAFLGGLASFFSACILPVIPVYIAYFADVEDVKDRRKPMVKAMLFVLGLSTTFVLLGYGAGQLGSLLYSDTFLVVCGAIVVILGIHYTGLIQVKLFNREKKVQLKRSNRSDYIGAYLLGLTFSFGWTPCISPILVTILSLSAAEASGLYGGFLMFIYSLGLMVPFLLVAIFSDYLLGRLKKVYKYFPVIKIIGGSIIIIMGILLMTGQLVNITVFFERLF